MPNNSSKIIVIAASTVFFLIFCLVIFAGYNIGNNNQSLDKMAQEQENKKFILDIRDNILNRAFILFKIHESNNFQERQTYFNEFEKETIFYQSSIQALNTSLDNNDQSWNSIKPVILENYTLQKKIIELMQIKNSDNDETTHLRALLNNQSQKMIQLVKLFGSGSQRTGNNLATAKNDNNNTRNILSIFGFLTIFIGIIVTRATVKAIKVIESNMSSQGTRIRELYKISALPISIDEQIYEMLKLEAQVLDMEIGKVCKIEPEEDKNTFVHIYSIPSLNIPQGRVAKLEQTFCSIAYKQEEPLAIDHVAKSKYNKYMCYSYSKQESYIAHQVWVKGKLFGTISFSSSKPRKSELTEVDKELIRLMANWVSVALERKMAAEEMTKAKQIAEQANIEKSSFLANMSHEIRTPLTAIIGFADNLQTSNFNEEQRKKWTGSIVRNSTHLHQIINDILDLSKIEAGQLEVEKTNISPSQILNELDSIVGSQTRDKGLIFNIEYQFPYPKTILSDPTRLKQILINLCGNALKFTTEGGITIKTYCDNSKHQLIFEVIDTGIGMSSEQTEKIFQPFSQADSSTTREYGGTGLGLTISRQLTEKLGGVIQCHSQVNVGSSFIVSINTGPLSVIEFSSELSQLHNNKNQSHTEEYKLLKGHVLLAEDNTDNQNLIEMYVNKFGLDIDFANNGQIAVEKVTQEKYDLVLMDMQMPVMGGLEAIGFLRQMGCTLPIIALTANAMTSDKDKCLKAGADDYATKPINVDNFYHVLANYLPEDESNISISKNLDTEKYNKLTENFMNKLPNMIQELNDAVNHLQWDSVQSISHILKGMGGSFGHPEITRVSNIINKDTIKKNFDNIPTELQDLKIICDDALNEFQKKSSGE